MRMRRAPKGSASTPDRPASNAEKLETQRLGVMTMLAVGVEVCKLMASIQEIKDAAFAVRADCLSPAV